MAGFDHLNPLDNSKINAFPANERAMRAAIRLLFIQEHDEATGWHTFSFGSKATRDALVAPVDGMVFARTDAANPGIDGRAGGTWDQIATLIPPGTVAVFYQNAAPSGWTFVGSLGDHLLMATDTVGDGGSVLAGSDWAFTGVIGVFTGSTEDYTLLIADIPSHTHGIPVGNSALPTHNKAAPGKGTLLTDVSDPTGGDGAHKHSLDALAGLTLDNTAAWRPASLNVILCSRASAL